MAASDYTTAFVIAAVLILAWVLFYHDSEGMWANYDYNSQGEVLNTGMTGWQSVTQGGIPNFVTGRASDGGYIGKYDYLGKNYSGLNIIPGDFADSSYYHQGYKDCGCGCNGQKKADVAVANAMASGNNIPATTPVAAIKAKEGYVQSRALTYGLNQRFNVLTPYQTMSGFSSAPMDPSNVCSKGLKGTLFGRCSEGFGANPNQLAQSVETVGNSARSGSETTRALRYGTSQYWDQLPNISPAAVYGDEIDKARDALTSTILAESAMSNTASAMALSDRLMADIPPINSHIDSPTNGPRHNLYHADIGKYEGQNIVSAFDGRTR